MRRNRAEAALFLSGCDTNYYYCYYSYSYYYINIYYNYNTKSKGGCAPVEHELLAEKARRCGPVLEQV